MKSNHLKFILICLNAAYIFITASFAQPKITLSEVMFDPLGSEYYDEFIEIYNYGAVKIDLTGWQISDGTGVDLLVANQESFIQPGEFAIILDAGYAENSTTYDSLIPQNVLRLTIPDNAIGSGGLSNKNPETIYLISSDGDTISQYIYSVDNNPGYSDEKIELSGPNDSKNWRNSNVLHGTPGFTNSVSKLRLDLGFKSHSISFLPLQPIAGELITIYAKIFNLGKQAIRDFWITFYDDKNKNEIPNEDELLSSQHISDTLIAEDSIEVSSIWQNASPGAHIIIIEINYPEDENLSNNLGKIKIVVDYVSLDLIVNEIMYRPSAGAPEWVELFNRGENNLDLAGWSLSDSRAASRVVITDKSSIVQPGEFIIVAEDSNIIAFFPDINCQILVPAKGFPALNNDKDAVVIRNSAGRMSDSVYYHSSWGGELGISLERKRYQKAPHDPENWGTSLNPLGGTPGAKNSISPLKIDLKILTQTLTFKPEILKFGETDTLFGEIKNVGLQEVSRFSVKLYDNARFDSSLTESIAEFEIDEILKPDSSTMIQYAWNPQISGIRNIALEVLYPNDLDPLNNRAYKSLRVGYPPELIVINEIMYSPLSGFSEWVELYNLSEQPIDLAEWLISDQNTQKAVRLSSESIFIEPNGFMVVASDSSILDLYELIPNSIIIPEKALPNLNNDIESVVLYDLSGTKIDSIWYSNSWGGAKGISLERINPDITGLDQTNWSSSVSPKGATPAEMNSIHLSSMPVTTDLSISPNPFSPDNDTIDDFVTISYNLPMKTARVNLKIYDVRGRLIRTIFSNEPTGAQRSIIWDGRNNDGQIARMGMYIIYLEALDAGAGTLKVLRKVVVLAKRL